jgi:hypothetical protein
MPNHEKFNNWILAVFRFFFGICFFDIAKMVCHRDQSQETRLEQVYYHRRCNPSMDIHFSCTNLGIIVFNPCDVPRFLHIYVHTDFNPLQMAGLVIHKAGSHEIHKMKG